MDLGIEGRVALVAAATGGLGRAVATALAAEGSRVVVTGRSFEKAQRVAADLPGAVARELDIDDPDAPGRVIDEVAATLGPVDILVTNGPGPAPSAARATSTEAFEAATARLFAPQQRMIAAALPAMTAQGWGRILAVGSSGITAPLPGLAASNVARAALAAYLKTLAGEVAADGITANLLLPGRIATDRTASLDAAAAARRGLDLETVQEQSRSGIPARRYGQPDEFGAAAAFLCSERASYITGVALRCDGGLVPVL
ncbi:SDR family oxidoreductase [Cnuibacter sp. UC19_7]|uniref:SDR family oxidoreductase n=1 Tax=Cnuibacter sp. UC19_7 TaxID=3350166 RepID=UPI00366DB5D4